MAIGPEILEIVNEERIKDIEDKVDAKLSSKDYREANRRGTLAAPYFIVPIQCPSLNKNEKQALVDKYIKAGWKHVVVSNSDDNGEKPGFIAVELRVNPVE